MLGDAIASKNLKFIFFFQLTKRSAVHAVPVVSTPAIATAGYAVGASGARFSLSFFFSFLNLLIF